MNELPSAELNGRPVEVEDGQPSEARFDELKGACPTGVKRPRDTEFNAIPEMDVQKATRHVCEAVCPWWERPYGDQLQDKGKTIANALSRITADVLRSCGRKGQAHNATPAMAPAWLKELTSSADPQSMSAAPCAPLLGIIRSPVIEGYRNKSEFTMGFDINDKPALGFLMGSWTEGITAVADPSPCRHLSRPCVRYAMLVKEFIVEHSKMPAWNKRLMPAVGFWRLLNVREGRNSTFMPLPSRTDVEEGKSQGVVPAGTTFAQLDPWKYLVDLGNVLLAARKSGNAARVKTCGSLTVVHNGGQKCASLGSACKGWQRSRAPCPKSAYSKGFQMQLITGCLLTMSNTPPTHPSGYFGTPRHKAGSKTQVISEPLRRLSTFSDISPTACSWHLLRTGTIGLSLAQAVEKVIGIDIIESAVEDARKNAALNKIDNCEFVAGKLSEVAQVYQLCPRDPALKPLPTPAKLAKAEDVMPSILAKHATSHTGDIVAIADPPRAGLHRSVIQAILGCPAIKRLVFISCNPESLISNCGPKGGVTIRGLGARPPQCWSLRTTCLSTQSRPRH
eukprot:gene31144-6284_t